MFVSRSASVRDVSKSLQILCSVVKHIEPHSEYVHVVEAPKMAF